MKEKLSKFDSRNTSIECSGIDGRVYCSITYKNDEPSWINMSQKIPNYDEEGNKTSGTTINEITIYKDSIPKLIELLKENELI